MSNRLRTAIIVLVAVVWAINFTAPVFVRDYKPAPELNVAFMAIIGILTSTYRKEQDSNNRTEGRHRKTREENPSESDDEKEITR